MRSLEIDRVFRFLVVTVLIVCAVPVFAQKQKPKSQKPKSKKKSSLSLKIAPPAASGFHPTCNLDSGSVGFYFFPANLGAKWTFQTVSQVFDATSKLLKSDTSYSYEKIVSDSNVTLQGNPVLRCESSKPYRLGGDSTAAKVETEYYVDDSVVMTVFNHAISNNLNHFMLVNPLRVGAWWKDTREDTLRTYVIAVNEPVSTPIGDYPQSLVVRTKTGFSELSKYFVKGVGLVKMVFRGISPRDNGSFVVTSTLVNLERGDPKRSIKYRFKEVKPTLTVKPVVPSKGTTKKLKTESVTPQSVETRIKLDTIHKYRGQIRTWPRSVPSVDSSIKK
jgi:hypothetical protein